MVRYACGRIIWPGTMEVEYIMLSNGILTEDLMNAYKGLSFDAKQKIKKMRPGWAYVGPILNGNIYIDFEEWEKSSFEGYNERQTNIMGFKSSKETALSKELSLITIADESNIKNWVYCDKVEMESRNNSFYQSSYYQRVRRDLPTYPLFISTNINRLENLIKENILKAGYDFDGIFFEYCEDKVTSYVSLDDKIHKGIGATKASSLLSLHGKTFNMRYELERPHLGMLPDLNITSDVNNEQTLMINNNVKNGSVYKLRSSLNTNNFHDYKDFMNKHTIDSIESNLKKAYPNNHVEYFGKYTLVEGKYHLVVVS
jgi:hypothetical protein